MTEDGRQLHEREKREFLKIEDIKLGSGSLAAWGRKIEADIEVRYTDGSIVYRGPIWMYIGFEGDVFIHNASSHAGGLSSGQSGIWLGINGMAVGGQRRITIDPKLVSGGLLVKGSRGKDHVDVRKEQLVVETILTAACIPRLLRVLRLGNGYFIEREVGCRAADLPQRESTAPIWHLY